VTALHVPFQLSGATVTHVAAGSGTQTSVTAIFKNMRQDLSDGADGETAVTRATVLFQDAALTAASITLDLDDTIVRGGETWHIETAPPAHQGVRTLECVLKAVQERTRQGYRFRR